MMRINHNSLAPFEVSNGRREESGALVINADDWGRNRETTDRIGACILRKVISSVSAMVFMEDSERAAKQAREQGIDAGLHLNFTEPFSGSSVKRELTKHQQRIAAYLLRHRANQAIYHPGLANSFKYVVSAQLEEYCRLYGAPPTRLDGHHHMHLSANVVFGKLMPVGTTVRRNFSFRAGEKGIINRQYRRIMDRVLARRHLLSDYFFALAPLEPSHRLKQIFHLARRFVVEIETHPVEPDEYGFLIGEAFSYAVRDLPLACGYVKRFRPALNPPIHN